MDAVANALIGVGLLALLVGLVWVVVAFFKRRNRRTPAIVTGLGFVGIILGGILAPEIEQRPASSRPTVTGEPTSAPPTPTPTPLPSPTPTVDVEQEYRSDFGNLSLKAGEALTTLGKRLQSPALDNPLWNRDVRREAERLIQLHREATNMAPAPGWEEVHESFVLGMEHYSAAGSLLLEALDLADQGRLRSATDRLDQVVNQMTLGQRNIEYALQLVQERFR